MIGRKDPPRAEAGAAHRARRLGTALLRVAPLGLAVIMQITWFWSIASHPHPMAVLRRDWWTFYDTGRHLVTGATASIYPQRFDSGYLWLYPPYCIYLTLPLGLVPEAAAYALCFAVEVVAVVAALVLLRAALPAPRALHGTAAAVVLASMAFNTTVALGQISGVLTLILAAVLVLWVRRRTFAAGLVAGLLFVKPHIALFVAAAALLTRQWTMVAGAIIGFVALLIGSLPLGVARWTEYVFTTRNYAAVVRQVTPPLKQLTLYAFWRSLPVLTPSAALAGWTVSVAALVLLAGVATCRTGARSPDDRGRLLALTVLVALAANFYAYFYDGLLLTIPGIVWCVGRDRYTSRLCRSGIAFCIASVFVVSYVQVFVLEFAGISWAGCLIALWATFEACDLLARARASTASGESAIRQRATAPAPRAVATAS